MIQSQQVEELIILVSSLDKPALLRQFRDYPATFPVDFTPDCLPAIAADAARPGQESRRGGVITISDRPLIRPIIRRLTPVLG